MKCKIIRTNKVSAEVTEVAGMYRSLVSMRKPTKSKGDSVLHIGHNLTSPDCIVGEEDMKLAKHLVSRGTVHGKFSRGIHVWFDMYMPRYMWSEIDTYTVGVSPISSESTMYTLVKECKEVSADMFDEFTTEYAVRFFSDEVRRLEDLYGGRTAIPIDVIKAILPEGWIQGREKVFSYQGLGQLYKYRKNHRLKHWTVICDEIEKLPYFEEFIYCGVE